MPRYTFLLPAYKASFLDEALNSIAAQKYQDYKVIISDDCSPKDIWGIVERYCKDTRFSYRRNQENIGGRNLVEHWNLLVNMCDTEYLIMASDDDVFNPDFLTKIDELIEKYPDVDVARARVQSIDEHGNILDRDPELPEFVDEIGAYYQNVQPIIKCIANYVFKTDSLKANGGFIDYPLAWFSDIATILRESRHGKVNTSEILFSFRKSALNISSSQQTNNTVARKKLDAAMMYDRWMCAQHKRLNLLNTPLPHSHKQEILRNAIMYVGVISFTELLSIIIRFLLHGYFDDHTQFNWLVCNWYRE